VQFDRRSATASPCFVRLFGLTLNFMPMPMSMPMLMLMLVVVLVRWRVRMLVYPARCVLMGMTMGRAVCMRVFMVVPGGAPKGIVHQLDRFRRSRLQGGDPEPLDLTASTFDAHNEGSPGPALKGSRCAGSRQPQNETCGRERRTLLQVQQISV
jgi:hypothetical protein